MTQMTVWALPVSLRERIKVFYLWAELLSSAVLNYHRNEWNNFTGSRWSQERCSALRLPCLSHSVIFAFIVHKGNLVCRQALEENAQQLIAQHTEHQRGKRRWIRADGESRAIRSHWWNREPLERPARRHHCMYKWRRVIAAGQTSPEVFYQTTRMFSVFTEESLWGESDLSF